MSDAAASGHAARRWAEAHGGPTVADVIAGVADRYVYPAGQIRRLRRLQA